MIPAAKLLVLADAEGHVPNAADHLRSSDWDRQVRGAGTHTDENAEINVSIS
jgi:hypothetical protein